MDKYVYFKLGVTFKDRRALIAYAIKRRHEAKACDMIEKHLKKIGAEYDPVLIPFHKCFKGDINRYTDVYHDTVLGII